MKIICIGFVIFSMLITVMLIEILLIRCLSCINGKKCKERLFIRLIALLIGGAIFVSVHYLCLGYINIFWTFKCIYNKWIDYYLIDNYVYIYWLYIIVLISIVYFVKRTCKKEYAVLSAYEKMFLASGLSIMGLISIICLYIAYGATDNIIINEIMGNNYTVQLDDGSVRDYIELYNAGEYGCDLRTLYLSDDNKNLKKLSLEGQYVQSKEYLIIPLEGETSFAIDKQGEYIYLSDESGKILQEVYCNSKNRDYAYALNNNTGEWEYRKGTPGMENMLGDLWINPPSFSKPSGIYAEEFFLEIKGSSKDEIYYTTDCTTPTKESKKYTGSIKIYDKSGEKNIVNAIKNVVFDWNNYIPNEKLVDKAFVVKAIAYDKNGNKSEVVTQTYWISKDELKDELLISLVAEPDDLFGDEGIYVTGKAYDEWYVNGQKGDMPQPNFYHRVEIPANIEFVNNGIATNQKVGLAIQGASSRKDAIKRFSVFARKEYEKSTFDIELFSNVETHSIYFNHAFANTLAVGLVSDRNVAVQNSRKAVVYLNGEFLYHTYIMEKYNKTYFEQYYDISEQEYVLIKNGAVDKGNAELIDNYAYVYSFFDTNDISDEQVYHEYGEFVDIQSYIDYSCINLYLCNMDYAYNKNMIAYRKENKWNWAIYDIDSIGWNDPAFYGVETVAQIDSFSKEHQYIGLAFNKHQLFVGLKKNASFRKQFVLTFMDLVNENFSIQNVSKYLEENGYDLSWNNSFFLERAKYIVPYMAKEFELTGTLEQVQIQSNDPKGGTIKINTIKPTLSEGKWSGQYYTDYPITISVEVADGYVFEGFSGDYVSSEQEIEVQVKEGGIKLYANFKEIE